MKSPRRLALLLGLLLLLALGLVPRPISYTPAEVRVAADVADWAAQKVAESERLGVRPGNEERLSYAFPDHHKTPWAILYVHGFGASRAEGEEVVDATAAAWGMNTYYARLPCHGFDDPDKHAACTWDQWADTATEALAQMPSLGEHTLLMGTSMGGLLSTWLAAEHPEQVQAMILASPAYGFVDKTSVLLDMPIGPVVARLVFGDTRDASWRKDIDQRKVEGYDDHWTTKQRYTPLFQLAAAIRYITSKPTFEHVKAPVLLFYYYKDEENQDPAASVPRMKDAMAIFSRNNPMSRAVAVSDGAHVLFSHFVRTDKALIETEIDRFLGEVGAQKPAVEAPPTEASPVEATVAAP